MGCNVSNVLLNFRQEERRLNRFSFEYDKTSKYYQNAGEKIMDLFKKPEAKEFQQSIFESQGQDHIKLIRDFYDKHRKLCRDLKIESLEELEYYILLELSKKYFENNEKLRTQKTNIFSLIKTIFKTKYLDLELPKENKKELVDIVLNSIKDKEEYFPHMQNFYSLNIEKDYTQTKYFKAYNYQHLLFNDDLKPDSLNLFLTPLFFSNKSIIIYFTEIIKRTNPLYFLSLVVNSINLNSSLKTENFNLDCQMYSNLNWILTSVLANESLKVLAFSIYGNNKIVVPPEMSKVLLDIIRKDSLIGLYLGKWYFSKQFFADLFKIISGLNNLNYLALNFNHNNDKEFKKDLNQLIFKNNSLKVILISGINYSDSRTEWDNLISNANKNSNIEVLYHNNNLKDLENIKEGEEENQSMINSNEGYYIIPEFE